MPDKPQYTRMQPGGNKARTPGRAFRPEPATELHFRLDNEGVKRIYADMAELFLNPPSYKEDVESGTLRLVLRNNILVRHAIFKDKALHQVGIDAWEQLDDLERSIVTYMVHVTKVRTSQLIEHTHYSANTIQKRLTHLKDMGIVYSYGRLRDPQRYYGLTVFQ